ncbi:MAG: RNA polymerase sigma factor [Oceanococcus sp.]
MASILSFWAKSRGTSDFEQRLAPHIESLFRLACRLTNNAQDAEDLLQEVLVKLYPKREELAKIEQVRPWASRVLYRMFVDKWRRKRLEPLNESDLGEDQSLDSEDRNLSPEDYLQMRTEIGDVQEALDKLNEDHRTLIIMHDVEGYTLVELEVILEVPLGTLKSRVHRARARLKKLLLQRSKREPNATGNRVNAQ